MQEFVEKYDPQVQRLLEMLPGLTAWFVILFPIWGALVIPQAVAYFTLAFLVFWFYRSFQGAFLGVRGYFRIRQSEKVNWRQKYLQDRIKASLAWDKIRHLVIIPNVDESVEKLSTTLTSLVKQKGISPKKLIVVLAMEGRAEGHRERAKQLVQKFQGKFGYLWITIHPDGLPGEVVGKAANEAWAAKIAKKRLVDQGGWLIEHLTITSCDADACFHPRYFSALTYDFALNPNRFLRFWQSPIFWHNNIWRVPAFIRIVGVMGHTIHVADLLEPTSLFFNYSTYSSSLKLVDSVGYWDTNIIPEDWHIFFQAFFAKKGEVEVEPIFLPTNIDAPEAETYLGSLKSRYRQCRRHAWGATDIPYVVKQALKHPEIPIWTRFFRVYKLVETHLIWSTNWFILTLGAWLPALVNPVFKQTVLGYRLPQMSRAILTVCLLALLTMIVLDHALRPPRPKKATLLQTASGYLQWLTMPVACLLMSVLPGLDAQTRLMLGKYIEYQVTEKV